MIDMSVYRDLYASEAQEHLEALNRGLLALERNPRDSQVLDDIFRSVHTLKGMSATMGYEQVSSLAHALEDLLDRVRNREVVVVPAIMELLFEGVDSLATLVAAVLADRPSAVDVDTLLRRMIVAESSALATIAEEQSPAESTRDTIVPTTIPLPRTVRVSVNRLDTLLNLVGEMVINRSRLMRIQQRCDIPELGEALKEHTRLLTDMRDAVLETRMVPVSQVFSRFPRMVRDLLHAEGKEADFIVEGGEIELDRTILQEITDPLMHLLRNAVDHGIETPSERERRGKPRGGSICLSAARERDVVIIEISDDGRGMKSDEIRETAISRGLITPEEAEGLAEAEILMLICHPNFSMAQEVTEVSGRGVGMSVVKRRVETLRGSIEITSEEGVGSTFRVLLQEDERVLPLVSLAELVDAPGEALVDAPGEAPLDGSRFAVVVGEGRWRMGLVVDDLLSKEEIVIKSLDGFLGTIDGLAGATILGEGQVVLILDVGSLIA